MQSFCEIVIGLFDAHGARTHAWCVLSNHYHALIETTDILAILTALGQMHGKLSFLWNGEEHTRGRQVWCGAAERYVCNDGHFWATMNYVHHNPVHHGDVQRWEDWPFSSAMIALPLTTVHFALARYCVPSFRTTKYVANA